MEPVYDQKIFSSFQIEPELWKTFDQVQPPVDVPIWLKLESGRIVLAILGSSEGSNGWWAVGFAADKFIRSTNTAYIAKGASWQPCKLFTE